MWPMTTRRSREAIERTRHDEPHDMHPDFMAGIRPGRRRIRETHKAATTAVGWNGRVNVERGVVRLQRFEDRPVGLLVEVVAAEMRIDDGAVQPQGFHAALDLARPRP